MSKKTKEKVVVKAVEEATVVAPVKVYPILESPEKIKFRERLEAYERDNPAAWAIRSKVLLAKLEAMQ